MKFKIFARLLTTVIFSLLFSTAASAQVDEICGEFGIIPSLEAPRLSAPLVYGKINLKSSDPSAKFPKVSIVYVNRDQTPSRSSVGRTGHYCFKRTESGGGSLVVDIDGIEMARRTLPSAGSPQHREDFDIVLDSQHKGLSPSVVSSKFYYPPNDKTIELYKKAAAAEAKKDAAGAVKLLKEIVAVDPDDFKGWAALGAYHLQLKALNDADAALRRSITLKQEYPAPWITVGRLRVAQGQFAAAIEIFKHAIELDPKMRRPISGSATPIFRRSRGRSESKHYGRPFGSTQLEWQNAI